MIHLVLQYIDRPGVSFCSRTTYDDNAITNAVEIYEHPRSWFPTIFLLFSLYGASNYCLRRIL